jgi:hypothetical protein
MCTDAPVLNTVPVPYCPDFENLAGVVSQAVVRHIRQLWQSMRAAHVHWRIKYDTVPVRYPVLTCH